MEQVEIKYLKTDVWKVNKSDFLNEEVEEFTSRWIQKRQ